MLRTSPKSKANQWQKQDLNSDLLVPILVFLQFHGRFGALKVLQWTLSHMPNESHNKVTGQVRVR